MRSAVKITAFWALGVTLLLALSSCAPAATQPSVMSTSTTEGNLSQKVVLAVQPTSTSEKLSAAAEGLRAYLETELGMPVQLVFPTTYAGVIEALKYGHAQAAFMSAWPMALAVKHAPVDVVLAEVREVLINGAKSEAPYYYSYWVVLKESEALSLSALKGAKVCFPSPLSTSGYVAPVARLVELGLLTDARPADPKH